MGFWETLAGILPDSLIHIERDETNVTLVQSGEGHQLTALTDDEDGTQVLQVDMESLSDEEREEVVAATWNEQGELFVEESQKEKKAIEDATGDTEIQRTLEFFCSYLDDRHFEMLRAALYLRDTWRSDDYHLEPHELRKRKRDIAERYGEGAEVVCNLSTANYFDEEGYVRQLFEDYEPDPPDPTHQELFEEIIRNQPFTVFVGTNDSVPWVIGSVKKENRTEAAVPCRVRIHRYPRHR